MLNLFGLTLSQLQELCLEQGFPKFTARQLCDWLYAKGVSEIDAMTNLSLKVRAHLKEISVVNRPTPVNCQVSKDGTKKYLFPYQLDNSTTQQFNNSTVHYFETVFIPEEDRATLCVSCQVGCKMGCRFCATGAQGFHGSLSAGEILNQIFSIPEFSKLTNIVYMGMGEPMDNYDAVMQSIAVLTSDWGLGWSPHRITVSSVGITPMVKRFLDESECHLAISLHNPVPSERVDIMPMQRAYPISELVSLLRRYDWSHQRRLTFEYTMIRGVNDDEAHAVKLVQLLKGLNCRVNLIRYHDSATDPNFKASQPLTIQRFQSFLNKQGITCTLRTSRGEDIMAACGLLAKVKGGDA